MECLKQSLKGDLGNFFFTNNKSKDIGECSLNEYVSNVVELDVNEIAKEHLSKNTVMLGLMQRKNIINKQMNLNRKIFRIQVKGQIVVTIWEIC